MNTTESNDLPPSYNLPPCDLPPSYNEACRVINQTQNNINLSCYKKLLFTLNLSDAIYKKAIDNNIKLTKNDIPDYFMNIVVDRDDLCVFKKIHSLMINNDELKKIMIQFSVRYDEIITIRLYDYLIVQNAQKIISYLDIHYDAKNIPTHLLHKAHIYSRLSSQQIASTLFDIVSNKYDFFKQKILFDTISVFLSKKISILPKFIQYIDVSTRYIPEDSIIYRWTIAHQCFSNTNMNNRISIIKQIIIHHIKSIFLTDSNGFTPFDLFLINIHNFYQNNKITEENIDDIFNIFDMIGKNNFLLLANNKTKRSKKYKLNSMYGQHYVNIPKNSSFIDIIDIIGRERSNISKLMKQKIEKIFVDG